MSLHQRYCGESLLCDPIQRQYDGVNGPKTPIEGAESASPREPQSTARTGTQRTHPPASSHAHEQAHPPQRHPTAAPLAAAARPSWALRIIGARRLFDASWDPESRHHSPNRPFALSPAAPPRPRPWAGSVPVRTWQCPGAPSFHFHRRGRRDHQGTCTSAGAGEGGLRTAGNCWRRLAARRATTGLNSQQQPPPPPPVAEPASPSLVMTHTSARCLQEGGGL